MAHTAMEDNHQEIHFQNGWFFPPLFSLEPVAQPEKTFWGITYFFAGKLKFQQLLFHGPKWLSKY